MGCFWFHLNPSSFLNALLTQATKPSSRCRTTSAGGTSWNFPANLGVWTAGHVCVLHITIAWIGISAGGFLRKTGEQMPSWTHNWLVILGHFRAFLVLVASQLFGRGNKHGICLAWHVFFDPELSWSSFWNIRGNSEWRGYRVYAVFFENTQGDWLKIARPFVLKPHQGTFGFWDSSRIKPICSRERLGCGPSWQRSLKARTGL